MKIPLPNDTELEVYESAYTPEQIEASIGKGTIIQNGTFWVWDVETMQYQDTGVYAGPGPGSVTTEMLADGAVTWPKLAQEVQLDHRNLLDNAYFIGGGSQQGGGQFPINQRGKSSYPAANGYTIDRWKVGWKKDLTLESDGVRLTTSTAACSPFSQQLEKRRFIPGRQYTLSFLVTEMSCGSFEVFISNNNDSSSTNILGIKHFTQAGLASVTVDIPAELTGELVNAYIAIDAASSGGTAGDLKIAAAKLELGPVQTLAHQDANGNWVLNDPPPKFGAALAEGQRYQVVYNGMQNGINHTIFIGVGTLDGLGGDGRIYGQGVIILPVPLRGKPAIPQGIKFYAVNANTPIEIYDMWIDHNLLRINYTVDGSTPMDSKIGILYCTYTIIDAGL